ncbi:MAG: sugar nucleotide-binding protein [Chloroflexota bacterium]|nr:MAG: hypothetical protein DIU68_04190 [Chloroflexota bacterium]
MRLYVTGGTGLVGSNVIRLARERYGYEVIASLYGPPPLEPVDYELDPLDMRDTAAVRASLLKYRPDVVIHCAALLDQVMMHRERELAWSIMVGGTLAFASACREIGARLVFVSSDWVFDGHAPEVDEDSPPFPVNFYGVMKMASERDLAAMDGLSYAVGRLAGVYGLNYAQPKLLRKEQGLGFDLGNYVVDRVSRGKVTPIWCGPNVNDVAHPTLASDGADMLLRLAACQENGIFHCFGAESISRLEFAHRLAALFGADPGLIAPVPTDPEVLEAHANIRIPFRTRARAEKTAKVVGRRALLVDEALAAFRQEWEAYPWHDIV